MGKKIHCTGDGKPGLFYDNFNEQGTDYTEYFRANSTKLSRMMLIIAFKSYRELAQKGKMGYSQAYRNTYTNALFSADCDPAKIKESYVCSDCSAFASTVVAASARVLQKTIGSPGDQFEALKDIVTNWPLTTATMNTISGENRGFTRGDYKSESQLLPGDIVQCNKGIASQDHAVIYVGNVTESDLEDSKEAEFLSKYSSKFKNEDGTGGFNRTEGLTTTSMDEYFASIANDGIVAETSYVDNFYTVSATSYAIGQTEYEKSLESTFKNGSISFDSLQAIFGSPHQYLPSTDPRISNVGIDRVNNKKKDSLTKLGFLYADKILSHMPLLLITPGVPSFMSAFSKKQKSIVLESFFGNSDSTDLDELLNSTPGRYYTLKFDHVNYARYVNVMLRTAAVFLNIGEETIDESGEKLESYNWHNYALSINDEEYGDEKVDDEVYETRHSEREQNKSIWEQAWDVIKAVPGAIAGGTVGAIKGVYDVIASSVEGITKWVIGDTNSSISKILGPFTGCIAFYADCGTSVDDSFSNSTTESGLASKINGLSDTGREFTFLLGNVGSYTGLQLDKLLGGGDNLDDSIETLQDKINNVLGGNNIISNILGKATRILAGGKMIFPEIWSDSSFSRSYSCKMKLISPAGDTLSIFLNILVPIYHLLALTLPRQSDAQTFYSPFLVRAFCKSLFNIEMGIITNLNVTRGAEGEWNIDGLPTVAEVSFDIKDLYQSLMMTPMRTVLFKPEILSNPTELEYIATSCGININDHDIGRTARFYRALGIDAETKVKDDMFYIFGPIASNVQNWASNLFSLI